MENELSLNRESTRFAFRLAREVQQYVETNAEEFNRDAWDNIQYWRAGILSQGAMTEENLSEIIEYIGQDKLQELITVASS